MLVVLGVVAACGSSPPPAKPARQIAPSVTLDELNHLTRS